MNKKQFDHIENKIKEAAENTNYAFEEQAWNKMESLLNRKDDKKRRVFAWWWFALPAVVFSGVYFIINNKGNEKIIGKQDKVIISTENSNTKYNTQKVETEKIITQNNTEEHNAENVTNNLNTPIHTFIINQSPTIHTKIISVEINTAAERNNISSDVSISNTDKSTTDSNSPIIDDKAAVISKKDISIADNLNVKTLLPTSDDKKTVAQKDTIKNKSTDKKSSSHSKGFYLLASIGADAASTKLFSFNNSSLTARYGVGIGFQLNKKFSIQTGFYVGHKIYVAGPGEYTPEYGSYLSRVDITKVNANCLVYDIPLTLRYNILQNKKITYYATSSISSFIMKNEAYNYYYTENNISYQESKTYTGNENLFSVLGLSIGVEKPLTNKLSLLAEPSVNIPLAGVGEGDVKLYSAILLFGLKYNFSKK